jgi:hypothetical protein
MGGDDRRDASPHVHEGEDRRLRVALAQRLEHRFPAAHARQPVVNEGDPHGLPPAARPAACGGLGARQPSPT